MENIKHPHSISVICHKDDAKEINARLASVGLQVIKSSQATQQDYYSLEHKAPRCLVDIIDPK